MTMEIRELNTDELSLVAGGAPVPGGTVTKWADGSTSMKFGNTEITVGKDGSLTTSTYVPKPS